MSLLKDTREANLCSPMAERIDRIARELASIQALMAKQERPVTKAKFLGLLGRRSQKSPPRS